MSRLGDASRPRGVTLAFTERTGGVSCGPYASLNLGDACGDDAEAVAENRRRVLDAMGFAGDTTRLVNPVQVHGTDVVVIADGHDSPEEGARRARQGADAVVCTRPDVPVLLCAADCALVVLVTEAAEGSGAFAVVHSGWRGTIGRISAKALAILCEVSGTTPEDVLAYVGPHIGAADFEVSCDLADEFRDAFGKAVTPDARHVDLGLAIRIGLRGAGVPEASIVSFDESVCAQTERFFSYRASGGTCGRHGAVAFIGTMDKEDM